MFHREVLEALRLLHPKVAVFTSVPIAGSHARSAPPGDRYLTAVVDDVSDVM
jgi:putative N-acetylmannosamine-6-phosphate epimerase